MTKTNPMTKTDPPPALNALEADGVWVVGGAIRDALSSDQNVLSPPARRNETPRDLPSPPAERGEMPKAEGGNRFDLDIAVAGAEAWAQRAGDALNVPAVKISAHFDIWRIPVPGGQLDVWELPDDDIERDLRRRDFTVNAMAVPLESFRRGAIEDELIDPLGGLRDIRTRRLRLVSDTALQVDPLRMLRAVRLEAETGWRPDRRLRESMHRNAALITRSAAERQWDELQRILRSERLPWALRRMERSGLLDALIPELADGRGVDQRPVHRRDVFWHQIDAVRWLTRLTSTDRPRGRRAAAIWSEVQPLVDAPQIHAVLDDWRLSLRLATLLHDIGKPRTRSVDADGSTHFFGHSELGAEMAVERLRRLRAPTRVAEQVSRLIEHHLRPGQVNSPGKPPTERALHRFHRALGEAAVPLCWLFLADSLATAGPEALLPRWRGYAAHVARILAWQPKRPSQTGRILDGHAIMQATGLEPGPLVGEIRAKIDEAAAIGEIADADDARELATRLARELRASTTA